MPEPSAAILLQQPGFFLFLLLLRLHLASICDGAGVLDAEGLRKGGKSGVCAEQCMKKADVDGLDGSPHSPCAWRSSLGSPVSRVLFGSLLLGKQRVAGLSCTPGWKRLRCKNRGGKTLPPWMDGPYPAPRGGKADRQTSFCSGGADAGGAEP